MTMREKILLAKKSNTGYPRVSLSKNGNVKFVHVHRLVAKYFIKKHHGEIDHIDRNRGNSDVRNLRLCTSSQNKANSKKRKNRSSKYKGVSYLPERKKWLSQIKFCNKKISKKFSNEKDAALFYNENAKKLFGEFANLNIIK